MKSKSIVTMLDLDAIKSHALFGLTYAEVHALIAEVERLRAALYEQWNYNHGEHCGCRPNFPHAYGCQWPPLELLALVEDPRTTEEVMADLGVTEDDLARAYAYLNAP